MSLRKRVGSSDESPAKRVALDQDWKIYEEQVVAEHRRRWPCMRVYPWYAVPDDVLVACGWLNDFTAHMQCKAADGKLAYYREFGLDAIAVDGGGVWGSWGSCGYASDADQASPVGRA